jgi:hypothetical protein
MLHEGMLWPPAGNEPNNEQYPGNNKQDMYYETYCWKQKLAKRLKQELQLKQSIK